jgi:hypothetical protein
MRARRTGANKVTRKRFEKRLGNSVKPKTADAHPSREQSSPPRSQSKKTVLHELHLNEILP